MCNFFRLKIFMFGVQQVSFFIFALLRVHWADRICRLMFLIKFGNFTVCTSSYVFVPFSLLSWDLLCLSDHLILCHKSLGLCSFLSKIFFSLCALLWMISIFIFTEGIENKNQYFIFLKKQFSFHWNLTVPQVLIFLGDFSISRTADWTAWPLHSWAFSSPLTSFSALQLSCPHCHAVPWTRSLPEPLLLVNGQCPPLSTPCYSGLLAHAPHWLVSSRRNRNRGPFLSPISPLYSLPPPRSACGPSLQ